MDNQARIEKMSVGQYKEIFGVEKYVFDRLLRLLKVADTLGRKSSAGNKPKLSVLDRLVITLQYWREISHISSYCV
jgi:hypothetical protein